jgi:hypothetical protein
MTRPVAENEPGVDPSGEKGWEVSLDDIRKLMNADRLPWPPDAVETPEAAHEATAGYKDVKEALLVTTDGPTREYADAAACEELMWAKKCLLESPDSEEARESLEKARKLLAFAEGNQSQAGFVEQEWREERELLDETLDRLEAEQFAPRVVNEMFVFDEDNREAIEEVTRKYKKLSDLRNQGGRLRGQGRATPAGPTGGTPQETPVENGPVTETAPAFEPVPIDRRELIKYEREHFAEFDPAKVEQFKAYLKVRLAEHFQKAEAARQEGREMRFTDTVAAVLGNGGEAPMFLGRAINHQLPAGERIDDLRVVLQMPFSEAAEKYLGIDMAKEYPDYFKTFSPRQG